MGSTATRVCGRCKTRPCAGTKSWRCTECKREENRAYWASLPAEKRREYDERKRAKPRARWRNSRKASHLMSQEEYEAAYAGQQGRCSICKRHEDVLVIDHCHERDEVRGLLCSPCNVAVGMLKHDPELVRRAAVYLEDSL